jgi:DnaK suppressor protein
VDDHTAVVLAALRDQVHTRLRALDASFDDVVASIEDVGNDDEHDPDGTTVAFERAQLIALRRAAEGQLRDVDAALGRLAAGTYGRCQRCRAPIAPERLEALPTTAVCVACA